MALGGSSLRELPPPRDAAVKVGTLATLLVLETKAAPESSLSESITSTLFPLLGRAGAGVDAMANGTAARGGGETDGGGVGREATVGTSGATTSPPPLANFAFFKNLASASRLEEVITGRVTKQRPIQIKQNGSTYSQTRADVHRGSSDASECI